MLLAIKFKNAAELFWDSLDTEERRLLIIYTAYLVGSVVLAAQSKSRERLKRQILEELRAGD